MDTSRVLKIVIPKISKTTDNLQIGHWEKYSKEAVHVIIDELKSKSKFNDRYFALLLKHCCVFGDLSAYDKLKDKVEFNVMYDGFFTLSCNILSRMYYKFETKPTDGLNSQRRALAKIIYSVSNKGEADKHWAGMLRKYIPDFDLSRFLDEPIKKGKTLLKRFKDFLKK